MTGNTPKSSTEATEPGEQAVPVPGEGEAVEHPAGPLLKMFVGLADGGVLTISNIDGKTTLQQFEEGSELQTVQIPDGQMQDVIRSLTDSAGVAMGFIRDRATNVAFRKLVISSDYHDSIEIEGSGDGAIFIAQRCPCRDGDVGVLVIPIEMIWAVIRGLRRIISDPPGGEGE